MTSSPMPMAAVPADGRRLENLALAYQELLTVGERLRSNRQAVSDAPSFRAQLLQALSMAQQEARRRGYSEDDINLAQYAVVAFLDESILSLRHPIFIDWPKRPLQEELYGHQIAGEVFFRHLQGLLGKPDSQDLADLLEVFQLCLLLGFVGRYGLAGRGELKAITDTVGDKIRRIRRSGLDLSPMWALPQDNIQPVAQMDPWRRWLVILSLTCLAIAAITWLLYKFALLPSGITALKQVLR